MDDHYEPEALMGSRLIQSLAPRRAHASFLARGSLRPRLRVVPMVLMRPRKKNQNADTGKDRYMREAHV